MAWGHPLLLTLLGLATKRKKIGQVFLACYMGMLFAWPYYGSEILVARHSPSNCLFSIGDQEARIAKYHFDNLLYYFCNVRFCCDAL